VVTCPQLPGAGLGRVQDLGRALAFSLSSVNFSKRVLKIIFEVFEFNPQYCQKEDKRKNKEDLCPHDRVKHLCIVHYS
jgi:hypothetical protein